MKQFTYRYSVAGAIAFLLLFTIFPAHVIAVSNDDALTKQVKTRLSYLEKLLHSSSADKLLAADQNTIHEKVKSLLEQANTALENGKPELADELAKEGFKTFTGAVKKVAKQKEAEEAKSITAKERFVKFHKSVNDLYLRLNAMNQNATVDQQKSLDKIAHYLATAEQFAARDQYYKALDQLTSAQNIISKALPETQKPTPEIKPIATTEKLENKKTDLTKTQAEPVTKTIKKEIAQKPEPKKTEVKSIAAPKKEVVKKAPVDRRTPQQKYRDELQRFQRYEKLIAPTLEREDLAFENGMQLINISDEARLKADRARGQAIDGNYPTALRLMRDATEQLQNALITAGAKI